VGIHPEDPLFFSSPGPLLSGFGGGYEFPNWSIRLTAAPVGNMYKSASTMASLNFLSLHELVIQPDGMSYNSFHMGTWMHHLSFTLDDMELGTLSTGPGFSIELKRFAESEIGYFSYSDNFEKSLPARQVEIALEKRETDIVVTLDVYTTYDYLSNDEVNPEIEENMEHWKRIAEKLKHQYTLAEASRYEDNISHFSYSGIATIQHADQFCKKLLVEINADIKASLRPGGWCEVGTIITK
jgi:hypothetical protein